VSATDRNRPPKVAADASKLGYGWWWDPLVAPEVYASIERMTVNGLGAAEIARRLGCSQRTVVRARSRMA
jgi:DNA-binding NarL/FixJ family response regulator